eukprot:TRINITY_DN13385_c0_g1_i4.p1 TRINITY_DN13385_c0_g1~~TRINITY_DN13385_c0_g1_i4.p1  ORF type:complete len:288 (+),score=38.61 TRINITY_DN13385_c0_g1_i4:129-992(+)
MKPSIPRQSMFLVWSFVALPCTVAAFKAQKVEGSLPVGRYAFIIRGGTFRDGHRGGVPCKDYRKGQQLEQAQSFVDYVLQPLEKANSTIDLFLTMPPCFMNAELKRVYGEHRIKFAEEADYPDQSSGFQASLNHFKQFLEKEKMAMDHYKFIVISRHDILFKSPITQLKANWSLVNFLSRCERTAPKFCLNDAIEVIPRVDFAKFTDQIGSTCGCFKKGCPRQDHGHHCRRVMENAGIKVGVLTEWQPDHDVRESSNQFGVIGPSFVSLEPAFAVPDEQAVSIHEHP